MHAFMFFYYWFLYSFPFLLAMPVATVDSVISILFPVIFMFHKYILDIICIWLCANKIEGKQRHLVLFIFDWVMPLCLSVGLCGLESINLSFTSVSDSGLRKLSGLTSLKSLNLDSRFITDAGISSLTSKSFILSRQFLS